MRLRIDSLQSRIVLFHLTAIVLAAIAVPVANYIVINRATDQLEARTLEAHAATIGDYLRRDADGRWRLDLPEDLHTLYAHGLDGLSYQVIEDNGHVLFASAPNSDAAVIPLAHGKLAHISRNGEVYGVSLPRGSLLIKVAQNVQHPDVIFDDIVANYLSRIGWLTIAILAILLGIDVLIIRDALTPVLRASRIAAAIDPERIDLRLPTENMPRELQPLILAMNAALARLEKDILLQREFTADAAHELRTPLAVLRARIETLPDHGVMATLHGDLEVMENIITHLLEIAEIEDAAAGAMARCDLQEISANVVSMLADRTIGQGKQIALTGHDGPVWIMANATMLSRAIRNLADNAIRHTPKETCVEVEVTPDGTVRVRDSGPGVPEANRALVFRRFWRGRRDNSDGAGLGLAIVSRIAEIHGAEVAIADNEGGGAVFSISFRTSPSSTGPVAPPHRIISSGRCVDRLVGRRQGLR